MGWFDKKPRQEKPKIPEQPSLDSATVLYAYHKECSNTHGLHQYYVALSAEQIDAYVDLLIADKSCAAKDKEECILFLALFSYACGERLPDRLYRFLIDNEMFKWEAYLRADEAFVAELACLLDGLNAEPATLTKVNRILCALAAIPCSRANDYLLHSSSEPRPTWTQLLHILPKDFAYGAGWEATEEGIPRILFDEEVTAFEPCPKEDASEMSPLTTLSVNCGLCGEPLTLVFNDKQKLATCLYCSSYQTIFLKVNEDGVSWHEKNAPGLFFQEHPEYLQIYDAEELIYGLCPLNEARRATWSASEFASSSKTQIGGMPTVINDMDYPKCLDCGRTMKFSAQLDMFEVGDSGDGRFYFFSCNDCGVTATNQDQM